MKRCIFAAIAAGVIICGCTSGESGLSSGQAEVRAQPPTEPEAVYSDYSEFSAVYKAENPDSYELPLPEESEDMKIEDISLGPERYVVSYDTEGTEDVEVVVEYAMTGCFSIDAFLAAQNKVPGSEISEKTEEYAIRKYESGKLELTALCGDNNTVCRLTIEDDTLSYDQLRQKLLDYKDKMGL